MKEKENGLLKVIVTATLSILLVVAMLPAMLGGL